MASIIKRYASSIWKLLNGILNLNDCLHFTWTGNSLLASLLPSTLKQKASHICHRYVSKSLMIYFCASSAFKNVSEQA